MLAQAWTVLVRPSMKAVLAALVLLPSIASADVVLVTGAPGSGQTGLQPFTPATPAKPKKQGIAARQDVVATNRGIAAPTAITVPEGAVEATLQVIVPFAGLAGLNAGITKSTEIWLEGAGTIVGDSGGDTEHEYGVGMKQVLLRTQKAAIALTGSMRKFSTNSGDSLLSIGAVGTACVDDDCNFEVSGSIARVFGFHKSSYDNNGPGENLITLSASAGNATTRVMLEAMEVEGESIGFLGVRFGNRTAAMDLALVTSLSDHSEGDIPALPWVGFSARL